MNGNRLLLEISWVIVSSSFMLLPSLLLRSLSIRISTAIDFTDLNLFWDPKVMKYKQSTGTEESIAFDLGGAAVFTLRHKVRQTLLVPWISLYKKRGWKKLFKFFWSASDNGQRGKEKCSESLWTSRFRWVAESFPSHEYQGQVFSIIHRPAVLRGPYLHLYCTASKWLSLF